MTPEQIADCRARDQRSIAERDRKDPTRAEAHRAGGEMLLAWKIVRLALKEVADVHVGEARESSGRAEVRPPR